MSNRNLVIVESPGKVKTLEKYLGAGFVVKGSVGHVRDLPPTGLGIDTNVFDAQYEYTERGQKIVGELRKLASECNQVWLATDADREGESIAWHLKESLGLKSYQRVVFREITPTAVQQAFETPRQIDMDMVNSQQGRRLLDRVIGYVVSPALSNATNEKLSAGRVQSVALLIIHELEQRIKNFVRTSHLGAKAIFSGYEAEWDTKPFVSEDDPYFMNREAVAELLKNQEFVVKSFNRKTGNRNAPPPLMTSTLQQAASVALGFSPSHTMQTAQSLYEAGAITYHRTDSLNLSDKAVKEIREFLTGLGKADDLPDTPNTWSSKQDAQDAHEAIRPSDISITAPDGAGKDALALYELIRNRALACQMKPAVYDTATATLETAVDIEGFSERPVFVGKAKSLVYAGWTSIAAENENEDDDEISSDTSMPDLVVGETATALKTELQEKFTKSPKRLTEAALVKALEKEGIGRPSTYASILKNIIDRGYIEIKNRLVYECSLGAMVIDNLKGNFEFLNLSYTREMESALDEVASGNADFRDIVRSAYTLVSEEVKGLKKVSRPIVVKHPCGVCQRPLRLVKNEFWACTGYSIGECKKTYPNKRGVPDMTVKAPVAPSEHNCGSCGKKLVRRVSAAVKATKTTNARAGSAWYGCSGFPNCKQTYFEKNNAPDYASKKN